MNHDGDGACIFCISNIYSGKYFSSVSLVESLFKISVCAPPLETTHSEYNWIFLDGWRPCHTSGLLFSCLDKYAEGAKLSWNVLNSGNFLEVCYLFWIEFFVNNFIVGQTSNPHSICRCVDIGYCVLVKQMINTFFFSFNDYVTNLNQASFLTWENMKEFEALRNGYPNGGWGKTYSH